MHEELLPFVMILWQSLFAAAAILHTIIHQLFQYLTLANLPLNLFHESSLQYIGRGCLVTWIECNPKIALPHLFSMQAMVSLTWTSQAFH
jgi:hypothetical protein